MADFDQRELRNALGRFATGITVITTLAEGGKPEGLTANSFTALSLDPPLVLWCLLRNSPALEAFTQCSHFAINILRSNQRLISNQFATPAADKFAGIAWDKGLGGAPLLPKCLAYFECRHDARHEGGDHLIFIGEVERFAYETGQPLLYNAGAYGIAADHPDNFDSAIDGESLIDLESLW